MDSRVEPQRIFLSYGHDRYAVDAQRIKEDLESRGHTVWYDKDQLQAGREWAAYIEEGLKHSDKVVLLMTPHSVRRRNRHDPGSQDGFCLNEITKALERNKIIIPVLLVELDGGPPIEICRLQYLDMRDVVPIAEREANYNSRFDLLLKAIEQNDIDFGGGQARLIRVLRPLDFRSESKRRLFNFSGREWIVEKFEQWLDGPSSPRIYWLVGDAGIGKTCIAARLCKKSEVIAHHYCTHGHDDKGNPQRALLSIAYQIAQQLPEYNRCLQKLDLEAESLKNAQTLFDNLIVAPLSNNFPEPDGPRVIIIDALDEATSSGKNEIAQFIRDYWSRTPSWLRLFITSRPERNLLRTLNAIEPVELRAQQEENLRDLRDFLQNELSRRELTATEETISIILEKSGGLFLYLAVVLDELDMGRLTLDNVSDFPRGLSGYFERFFERQFGDDDRYQRDHRPLIEMIIAAREPLPLTVIQGALSWDDYKLNDALQALGSLFPQGENQIRPFHNSITTWLTEPDRAGKFFVKLSDGHRRLADYCWKERYSNERALSAYILSHLPAHMVELNRWEELLYLMISPKLKIISNWIQRGDDRGLMYMVGVTKFFENNDRYRLPRAGICTQIARMHSLRGEYDVSREWLQEALRTTTRWNGRRVRAAAFHGLGSLLLYEGDGDGAAKLYRRALRLCRWGIPVYRDEAAANLVGLASMTRAEGNYVKSVRFAKRAILEARRAGDVRHEIAGKRLVGAVYNSLGKYEEAKKELAEGIALCELHDERMEKARSLLVLGSSHYASALLKHELSPDAKNCYNLALADAKQVQDSYCELESMFRLGLHALREGDNDSAKEWLRQVVQSIPDNTHAELRAYTEIGIVEVLHQEGQFTEALERYQQLLDTSNFQPSVFGKQSRCKLLLCTGAIKWHKNNLKEAETNWGVALGIANSISDGERQLTEARISLCKTNPAIAPW